jgi:16S rRNA (guanine1207-N2)-methyltransferase
MDADNLSFKNYQLRRLPFRANEQLRAWDAADELLIKHIAELPPIPAGDSLLLINDQFGALACYLHQHPVTSWGDSFVSHQAAAYNLKSNALGNNFTTLPSTSAPQELFNWVFIKIPKSLALLEQQLIQLKANIHPQTTIIAAGMVKYLQKSHLQLFEKIIGQTRTSLAEKKARLVFVSPDENLTATISPYPSGYYQAELQLQLTEHANVFCRGKLDIGSRFMIEQFQQLPTSQRVLDLGCGNGVLGIVAKQKLDKLYAIDSHISFIDESYMAVASAKINFSRCFDVEESRLAEAQFTLSNCLEQLLPEAFDLILCNPPFHQNNVVGGHIAWQMFKQSKEQLSQGGQLWVVANRHLQYHSKIKTLFGNCRIIASNKKFVVLAATHR